MPHRVLNMNKLVRCSLGRFIVDQNSSPSAIRKQFLSRPKSTSLQSNFLHRSLNCDPLLFQVSSSVMSVNSIQAPVDDQPPIKQVASTRKRQHSEMPLEKRGTPNKQDRFTLICKTPQELSELIEKHGAPKYRSNQILDALLHGAKSIDDINLIPKTLRESLKADGVITGRSHIHSVAKSSDGTVKFLLQLFDGHIIETVGIPAKRSEKERLTACLSSQVGCALKCTFCATGQGGFSRNLTAHEIVDQVLTIQEELGEKVSHVVFMGMGEPLLNLKAVLEAQAWINEHIGIGGRKFTLSTVGVPNGIRRLAESNLQLTLAVSLHAPSQELRETLVPSAKQYPLELLLKDCRAYFAITKRRVSFEYTLLSGLNDSEQHAKQLAQLLEQNRLKTHVNLMLWNKVSGIDYKRPKWKTALKFKKVGIVALRLLGYSRSTLPTRTQINRVEDVNLDPESLHLYQKLMRLKESAVAEEDYDEAKRLKLQIEGVRQLGKKLAKLEVEKQNAVEIEDYDLAKSLKHKIHELRTRGFLNAETEAIENEKADFASTITPHSTESAPAQRKKEDFSETVLQEDDDTPDASVDVSPDSARRALSLSTSLRRSKHDEYDNRVAKAQGTYSDPSPEPPVAVVESPLVSANIPEGFPSDLPTPESISGANAKESLPLEDFAGSYIAQCCYSRNWQLREAALNYLEVHFSNLVQPGLEREHHRLLCQVVRRGLQDKVANVFLAATAFVRTLVAQKSLNARDIQFATTDFLPLLLEKLGDTNPRLRDASQESILNLARHKDSGVKHMTDQFLRPPKKQSAWRPLLGRLELISDLIDVIGIGKGTTGGFEIEQLMPFVSKGFLSPNAEVRSCAIALTAKLAQMVGPLVKRFIPVDVNPKVRQQIEVEVTEALSSGQTESPKKARNLVRKQFASPSSSSQPSPGSLNLNMESDDPTIFEIEIQKQEELLGKDHPDLCETLNSLALIYTQREEFDLAYPLLRRVLDISESHYGSDHSNVAHALTDLADEEEKGRPLLERALAIQEKNLGPDHPDVEAIRNVLAPIEDS
eukprot:g1677.t1